MRIRFYQRADHTCAPVHEITVLPSASGVTFLDEFTVRRIEIDHGPSAADLLKAPLTSLNRVRLEHLIAGLLSTIDVRPADEHPTEMLPYAERIVDIFMEGPA